MSSKRLFYDMYKLELSNFLSDWQNDKLFVLRYQASPSSLLVALQSNKKQFILLERHSDGSLVLVSGVCLAHFSLPRVHYGGQWFCPFVFEQMVFYSSNPIHAVLA